MTDGETSDKEKSLSCEDAAMELEEAQEQDVDLGRISVSSEEVKSGLPKKVLLIFMEELSDGLMTYSWFL